ncbi:MAG: type II toxin-antitoxin system VapC family toxin [Candidatus Hodarchaeales archaeon]
METAAQIVVDASVIIKWFVVEEDSKAADLVKDDYQKRIIDIAVPNLLPYEIANVLRYKPSMGENDLLEVMEAIDGFQFNKIPFNGDFAKKTVSSSLKNGITVYDAAYACLAEIKQCWFLTADKKLTMKLKGQEGVLLLEEYSDFRNNLMKKSE